MKSSIAVLIWTILFLLFGLYVNVEVSNFSDKYNSNVEIVEKYIEEDKWLDAKSKLENISKSWYEEKGIWYKLLNHEFFDNVGLSLSILDKSINEKNKSKSFEEIELIKLNLNNIIESQKIDLNHIL